MFLEGAVNYLAQQLHFQDVITLSHQVCYVRVVRDLVKSINSVKVRPLQQWDFYGFGFYIRSSVVQNIETNDKPLYINQ